MKAATQKKQKCKYKKYMQIRKTSICILSI